MWGKIFYFFFVMLTLSMPHSLLHYIIRVLLCHGQHKHRPVCACECVWAGGVCVCVGVVNSSQANDLVGGVVTCEGTRGDDHV